MDVAEARRQLQQHIAELFAAEFGGPDVPRSRAAFELEEEVLSNSLERYDDLTADGMEPVAAYNSVVGNIGDIHELTAALPEAPGRRHDDPARARARYEESRKRRTLLGGVSGLIWILCVIVFFVVSFATGGWAFTWMIFLVGACAQIVAALILKLKEFR